MAGEPAPAAPVAHSGQLVGAAASLKAVAAQAGSASQHPYASRRTGMPAIAPAEAAAADAEYDQGTWADFVA
jgi:hypothetical protein